MKKTNTSPYFIYGKHPSVAALSNKARIIHKILATNDTLALVPDNHKTKVEILSSKDISKALPRDVVHQGIAVLLEPIFNNSIDEASFSNNSKIVILDQVTDPHNLGAILRNAAAFNIEAVILPSDNSPEENGVIAKTSSGALEIVPIYKVTNISSTMGFLKKNSFWIVGLDGASEDTLSSKHFSGRTCIVLGAEGVGMRRLTKQNCDFIAKISMCGKMESLNVSSASAIAFYLASISA